jgi:hypothetical protein
LTERPTWLDGSGLLCGGGGEETSTGEGDALKEQTRVSGVREARASANSSRVSSSISAAKQATDADASPGMQAAEQPARPDKTEDAHTGVPARKHSMPPGQCVVARYTPPPLSFPLAHTPRSPQRRKQDGAGGLLVRAADLHASAPRTMHGRSGEGVPKRPLLDPLVLRPPPLAPQRTGRRSA